MSKAAKSEGALSGACCLERKGTQASHSQNLTVRKSSQSSWARLKGATAALQEFPCGGSPFRPTSLGFFGGATGAFPRPRPAPFVDPSRHGEPIRCPGKKPMGQKEPRGFSHVLHLAVGQNRFGIPFWSVGEFTTHCSLWKVGIGMFTAGF